MVENVVASRWLWAVTARRDFRLRKGQSPPGAAHAHVHDRVCFSYNEAKAYKADIVPKARGEAKAIKERAEAYRQRVFA